MFLLTFKVTYLSELIFIHYLWAEYYDYLTEYL